MTFIITRFFPFSHFGNPHSRRRSRSRQERSAGKQSGGGGTYYIRKCFATSVKKHTLANMLFLQLKRHDFEPLLNCQRTKLQNSSWEYLAENSFQIVLL
jgi:hypothetical protein